ncbi:putative polysaccharide biosynthesis protein [Halobacillus sp. K22]|uniref:putative polysaccharide biosynthesis protein n=1 Tax=Halobacillus sp. K22 TaxID=3457431 RepID=UPI003FCDEED8
MSRSTFFKSTFILTLAALFSKILGSLFRIPLQNIAGDEVLGIFTLVYPVYMVTLILSVAGIPLAISKLIAEARTNDNTLHIRLIYVTASILGLLFGVFSFTVIAVLSSPISQLLGGPEIEPALLLVATGLLIAPYMAVYRGYFQGYENMNPTAISQVIEQFFRAALVLLIAYVLTRMSISNEWIAGGIMAGSLFGVLASFIYLRFTYVRSPKRIQKSTSYSFNDFKTWSRTILRISIPIAIGAVTMALLNFVDSFTIPFSLERHTVEASSSTTYLYGIYGRGLSLVQIATVFATSIILPLVPLLTAKQKEGNRADMRSTIEATHRLTNLISWPAAIGLAALAIPLNVALFTNAEGSLVIAILGVSSVFTSLTIVGTGILQGLDFARKAAIIIIAGVVCKTFLNLLLVSWLGLEGAGLSTLIVYVLIAIVNTFFIVRYISFSIVSKSDMKIIGSSIVMGLLVGLPSLYYSISDWGRWEALLYSLLAIILGGIVYIGCLYALKAIDRETLKRMPIFGKYLS